MSQLAQFDLSRLPCKWDELDVEAIQECARKLSLREEQIKRENLANLRRDHASAPELAGNAASDR